MKILFAVNNEKASEAIIKEYQARYKEIISCNNVYFFNAIIKELQKDKSYDRIVIGEDLEAYSNNNYEVIDNFLFDKLDSISDEASNSKEGDIPIILIATDRREKGDPLLVKLFGIGIYNVLLGSDRRIDNVCQLINQPRTKKEAKAYYKIDSDDVGYQEVDPDSVSEIEVQNIIRHYKKLGRDEAKYVESFNEIAEQYTDAQLKLITKYLPLNVRAVLEEKCPKYQQVMIGSVKSQVTSNGKTMGITTKNIQSKNINKIELIDKELQKAKLTKPVVIPSAINMQEVKKVYTNTANNVPMGNQPTNSGISVNSNSGNVKNNANSRMNGNMAENIGNSNITNGNMASSMVNDRRPSENIFNSNMNTSSTLGGNISNSNMANRNVSNQSNNTINSFNDESTRQTTNNVMSNVPVQSMQNEQPINQVAEMETGKKGRGRPRKEKTPEELAMEAAKAKKGRGRPRKNTDEENVSADIDLFGLSNNIQNDQMEIQSTGDNMILPGFEDDTPLEMNENVDNTVNSQAQSTTQPSNQSTDIFGMGSNDDFFNGDYSNQLPGMDGFDSTSDMNGDQASQNTSNIFNAQNVQDIPNVQNTQEVSETQNASQNNQNDFYSNDFYNDPFGTQSMNDSFDNPFGEQSLNSNPNDSQESQDYNQSNSLVGNSSNSNASVQNIDDSFFESQMNSQNIDSQGMNNQNYDLHGMNMQGMDVQTEVHDFGGQTASQENVQSMNPQDYGSQGMNGSSQNVYNYSSYSTNQNNQIQEINKSEVIDTSRIANLITGDKKIVAFVGTSKNGTSFLVNNLAVHMAGKGIKTAILDLTKNKNAYYIYNSNEDALRDKAFKCIDNLRSGVADGIQVNKNFHVYTTLPGENPSFMDYGSILETLVKNYSLILLDCDFDTDFNYFANSQEIYLVQTYDILTIQPLTAFLNELKYKNILDQNKLRIVINKTLKLRKLTDQMIIGGLSRYNDPASTYINKLFDENSIRYTTIPFEDQTYARYLERLVDCEISLNGYSKMFLDALSKLGDMVYPLIASSNKNSQPKNYNNYNKNNKNTTFNSDMNATLNKMRNNY